MRVVLSGFKFCVSYSMSASSEPLGPGLASDLGEQLKQGAPTHHI